MDHILITLLKTGLFGWAIVGTVASSWYAIKAERAGKKAWGALLCVLATLLLFGATAAVVLWSRHILETAEIGAALLFGWLLMTGVGMLLVAALAFPFLGVAVWRQGHRKMAGGMWVYSALVLLVLMLRLLGNGLPVRSPEMHFQSLYEKAEVLMTLETPYDPIAGTQTAVVLGSFRENCVYEPYLWRGDSWFKTGDHVQRIVEAGT